jgi:tetratricopeptide (TPR) repeat protein
VVVEQNVHLQQLWEVRRFSDAGAEYQRLLTTGVADAESHLLGALVSRFQPDPDYRLARQALELAEAAQPTGVTLGKVRLAMGNLLREIGETTAAIERYQAFIQGVGEYKALQAVCMGVAHYNLGLALRCARRFDEAVAAYESACQEFRANDFPDYLRQCLQNMAWLHCLMGNVRDAESALVESEELCESAEARWQQQVGWAYLEAISQEHASALSRCDRIIKAEGEASPEVISHAYWVAGQVALSLGQVDQASVLADHAVTWSMQVKGDIRPMHDANNLRRDINQRKIHKDRSGA